MAQYDGAVQKLQKLASQVALAANNQNNTRSSINDLYNKYQQQRQVAKSMGYDGEIAPGYKIYDPNNPNYVTPFQRGFTTLAQEDSGNNASSKLTSNNSYGLSSVDQLIALKNQYNQAQMNHASQSVLDQIHQQADQLRQQSGLDNSKYGADVTLGQAQQNYKVDQVNNIYDQMQQSQLGALHASQQSATNRLNQQKAEYGQQITGQKNQASVASAQAANKLRELMANAGLTSSGENVTASVANQSARQNALNALDQQYNNYSRDIANQISAVNDPIKEQSILSQLNAQRAQALYNAGNDAWNQNFQQSQANQQQQNWQSQFDWQKKQADAQQAWQKYQYNNMSAAQKAQFDQNASQFGQNMAWNMWNAQYNGNLQQAMLNAQLASFNDTSGGGDYNNYRMMPQAQKSPNYRNFVQDLSSAMKKTGVPESWLTPLSELVGRESSWNSSAKNPSSTAHGYAQFLDSTVKNYAKYGNYNNPVDQLVMMMHYIKDRYGTPQNALKFWDANHYY